MDKEVPWRACLLEQRQHPPIEAMRPFRRISKARRLQIEGCLALTTPTLTLNPNP